MYHADAAAWYIDKVHMKTVITVLSCDDTLVWLRCRSSPVYMCIPFLIVYGSQVIFIMYVKLDAEAQGGTPYRFYGNYV